MSKQKDLVKKMLHVKKPVLAEVELTLFEFCHLDCDFCGHAKKSTVGLSKDEIMSKLGVIREFLPKVDKDVTTVQLQLVGGELLQDKLIQNGYLEYYYDLVKEIKDLCIQNGKTLQVMLVTANVFKERERVKEFLDKAKKLVPFQLILSYDLAGRPMGKIWKDNLTYFQDYVSTINTVATKPAIRKLIDEGDEYFDYLYNNFEIFVDNFIPDVDTIHLIPTDDEHLEFLKFMSLRYSSIHPIAEIVNKYKHPEMNNTQIVKMSCLSLNKITIFPDNTWSNCRWRRYKQENFKNQLVYEDNSNMVVDFLNENNCFSCKYYNNCPFSCFTQWSWKQRERSPGCTNKKWFDFLETVDWEKLVSASL